MDFILVVAIKDGSCNSTGTSTAFSTILQVDQYVNNGNKQGFRLNGSFSLKDIANNNIQNEIGSASSTPLCKCNLHRPRASKLVACKYFKNDKYLRG